MKFNDIWNGDSSNCEAFYFIVTNVFSFQIK